MGGKGFPEVFVTGGIEAQDPKPDYKIARNWEAERVKKQVHLHNPTFVDQGIGTISGGTSGTINGFIVESSKREAPVPENQDYNKVPKRTKIEDWFRPCTPPHQIYSRNAYPPWVQEVIIFYLVIMSYSLFDIYLMQK
ncbi:hypothetical protein Glove_117g22 [Diversispora epigaea]|uniref:Uncharacterized protein n=1 Tax=Diversispora epigaea TaxID=1348612 RepID=A0A397J0U2_9GLOM|nr:hypothetical protein Glove_117g22 [Diversispora epigaea]